MPERGTGRRWMCFTLAAVVVIGLSACIDAPPRRPDDICDVFRDYPRWYKVATNVSQQRGVPLTTLLAFVYRESRFIADARPPRRRYFGFIPGPRLSSAYGYAQALDDTWEQYQDAVGRQSAKRDRFADAIDFIAWYIVQSERRLKLGIDRIQAHYIAYHEGRRGYLRGDWKKKNWLMKAAVEVDRVAQVYRYQLSTCAEAIAQY